MQFQHRPRHAIMLSTNRRNQSVLNLVEIPVPSRLITTIHPFFDDLPTLSSSLKAFDNKVLATEDDIFEECSKTWTPYKNLLLGDIYDAAVKLEDYIVLSIMIEVNSKVADVLGEQRAQVSESISWTRL